VYPNNGGGKTKMGKIAVVRIAGQPKQKKKVLETLNRLKLRKKFTCTFVNGDDKVRMGMVESAAEAVMYGAVSEEFAKEMVSKREKSGTGIMFLHPPRGGFKKSSKVAAPKGILGRHEDISKIIGRML